MVLVLLLAAALAGTWFLLRGGDARPANAGEISDRADEPATRPVLQLPELRPRKRAEPALPPAPNKRSENEVTVTPAKPEPLLDVPDYGEAVERGGAVADFELYDCNGYRVPVRAYYATLWRKIGNYWLQDEVRRNDAANAFRCDGLSDHGHNTGLEPGEYELELKSNAWGNFRHQFSVVRGEHTSQRLTTPNWRQLICFNFTSRDGTPVAYLPAYPKVKTTSAPLPTVRRSVANTVCLRSPPGGEDIGLGGTGWAGSGDRGIRMRPNPPPLFPTDDGRWWVYVLAGGKNTVTFNLGAGIWGQDSYTVTDNFVGTTEVNVTLNTTGNLAEKYAKYGKIDDGARPGNRPAMPPASKPERAPFDPYTAVIGRGKTRVILQLRTNDDVEVQVSRDGKTKWKRFVHGNVWWCDFDSDKQYWIRYASGKLFETDWRPINVASGGLVEMSDSVAGDHMTLDKSGLSPTLRAFGVTTEFQLARRLPEPTEDPRVIKDATDEPEPDPSDQPNRDLAENPNAETPNPPPASWDQPFTYAHAQEDSVGVLPDNSKFLFRLSVASRREVLVGGDKVERADVGESLLARTYLRGAARVRHGHVGYFTSGPDGRFAIQSVILNGTWKTIPTAGHNLKDLLTDGALKPSFSNLLIARAVGPQTEGLPWVKGVVLDYDDDTIAQQVRQIVSGWAEDRPLKVDDADTYKTELAGLAKDRTEKRLRNLLGDKLYESFQTDDQREWYARNGAWYDTHRKVYSDEQGYIAVDKPRLRPGKCYVMYLWSNSKDPNLPDARFAFKVDKNGVADLGAIRLPTYLD